jgi:hypothetical protein
MKNVIAALCMDEKEGILVTLSFMDEKYHSGSLHG